MSPAGRCLVPVSCYLCPCPAHLPLPFGKGECPPDRLRSSLKDQLALAAGGSAAAGWGEAGGGSQRLLGWQSLHGALPTPPRFPGPRRVLRLRCCSTTDLLECVRFMGEGACHLPCVDKHVFLCPSPAWA